MKALKQNKVKKAKLSAEEKALAKASRKKQFKEELQEGVRFFLERRYSILLWASLYIILSLVSLFFTKWTVAELSDFPNILVDLVPRMFSLLLLTAPAFLSGYRRSFFAAGVSVWSVWMLLLSDVSGGVPVAACILGAALTAVCVYYERVKGNTVPVSKMLSDTAKWLYAFAALSVMIEIIHRFDVDEIFFNIHAPFVTILKNPDIFANNLIVVLIVGLFVFICKKKKFAFSVYSFVWLLLAFVSFLKYHNVYEPVLLLDVFQIFDGLAAVKKYFSFFSVFLFGVAIALLIVGIVFLARREKNSHIHAFSYVIVLVSAVVLAVSFLNVRHLSYTAFVGKYVRANYFANGFPFSFFSYAIDSHLSAPEGYSQYKIDEIREKVETSYSSPAEMKDVQNVIVIQMESFCDPYLFTREYEDLVFERDPMPFLRSLSEKYSTGKVAVPVFGGQTVKSEFEFLTGMSMATLPSGYNPYVTYLNGNSVDSFVRYMKANGYTATAVHDYQGEFFSRHEVYGNLGFDTFIPYECMPNVEKRTGAIWAGDIVLAEEIERVLDSTSGKDFIFGVTVQLHGNYMPIEESEYTMKIENLPDKEMEGKVAYYVSQMEQFDAAIEALVTMLEERGEPTYVLFYSDHLPSLFYNVDGLSDAEKFTTQYFSWNNIGVEKKDEDTDLYRLSTRLCEDLGFEGTFVNQFHSVFGRESAKNYEESREIVDYYLLIDSANKPEYRNDMYKIGLYPLSLSSVEPVTSEDGTPLYLIHGNEITENAVITVNGHVYDLEFIDEHTAYFDYSSGLDDGDLLSLRIIGERGGTVLCESVTFVYKNGVVSEAPETDPDSGEDAA